MPLLSLSDISEKTYISYTETSNKEEKQFKSVVIAQRDDLWLNSHQRIQLQGWRANYD